MNAAPEPCRIDVWLWRARFFKTRALAARAVEAGGMRVIRAGQRVAIDKPSRLVRPGDVLVFPLGAGWMRLRIEAPGERRGPASEAQGLYARLETPEG